MADHTRQDWIIGVGGIALVFVLAYLSHAMQWPRIVEMIGDLATVIAGLGAVYFIYQATDELGGQISRYITIMGIGLGYYSLTVIPHVYAHTQQLKAIGPVSALAVFMWQHVANIWVFVLIAYGLYLFWQGGRQ